MKLIIAIESGAATLAFGVVSDLPGCFSTGDEVLRWQLRGNGFDRYR